MESSGLISSAFSRRPLLLRSVSIRMLMLVLPADRSYSCQFEASRLVMIQLLLHGLKMDPLVSLHYYAPVCAVINLAFLPFTEGFEPFYELARIGPLVFLSNALVAFCLNVAAVFLVSAGSGLVLTLAGVFKVHCRLPHIQSLYAHTICFSIRISSSSLVLA